MNMEDIHIYLPFEKKNSDQQLVEGYATTEALDSQGEVVKLGAIEKALPDYMKFGNIREMHQFSAVGKAISASVDNKGMYIVAKVVDKQAWEKVKEGVYSGFSIGGRIVKKVGNAIEGLVLNEISIVDRPANPQAIFSLVKMADGKVVDERKLDKSMGEDGVKPAGESHDNIYCADRLVAMAADIASTIMVQNMKKRPVKHLEKVLNALKDAAKFELETEKMDKAMADAIKREELLRSLIKAKESLEHQINASFAKRNSEVKDAYFATARKCN